MTQKAALDAEMATPSSLTAEPAEGQTIAHDDTHFATIREGHAYILVPADAPTSLDTKKHQQAQKDGKTLPAQSVFYNPIQQFNRDLSVLAIRAHSEHVVASREAKAREKREKQMRKRGKGAGASVPDGSNGGAEEGEGGGRAGSEQKVDAAQREQATSSNQQNDPTANGGADPLTANTDASSAAKRKADSPPHLDQDTAHPAKKLKATATAASPAAAGNTDEALPKANLPDETHHERNAKPARPPPFRILDALSATGLRALRYAKEIPAATSVTANDLSPDATRSIRRNVAHNRLDDRIHTTTENAMAHMYGRIGNEGSKYDVVDLDPYGTAVPFLDSAIHALKDGGLLCVTCTDAGVWASNGYPEKTFSLYGGNPIKGRHSHEGGLRLILNAIATVAARYGIAIEPLMSLSIDFYARVFVRVRKSPELVKFLAGKTMVVYNCDSGCGAFQTQLIGKNEPIKARDGQTLYKHGMAQAPRASELCAHCGFKTHLAGPMWAGPLHHPRFLRRILQYLPALDADVYKTTARIEGMLSTALEESGVEDYPDYETSKNDDAAATDDRIIPSMHRGAIDRHPFFFEPSALAGVIHCQAPGEIPVKGALRRAGFKAVRSHIKPGVIRTNAPWSFVWNMMREWVQQKAPLKDGALKAGTAGYAIMRVGSTEQQRMSKKEEVGASSENREKHTDNGSRESVEEYGEAGVVFDEALGKDDPARGKLVRYQLNPRENWGPMNRARG